MDQSLVHEAPRLAADLSVRGAGSHSVAVAARYNLPHLPQDENQKSKAASPINLYSLESQKYTHNNPEKVSQD
jgi:hypothetical protein